MQDRLIASFSPESKHTDFYVRTINFSFFTVETNAIGY